MADDDDSSTDTSERAPETDFDFDSWRDRTRRATTTAELAEDIARYFGEVADMARKAQSFDSELPSWLVEQVATVHGVWRKSQEESHLVGWLGKFLFDASKSKGSCEEAAEMVVSAMGRKSPNLREKLDAARPQIIAAFVAARNSGGGARGASTSNLDVARNELLGALGLARVSRKAWDKAVIECPGTKGRKEWEKRSEPPTWEEIHERQHERDQLLSTDLPKK